MTLRSLADVAELADAQVSEACDGDIVEVQVLSSAPSKPSTDYADSLWTESVKSVDGFYFENICHGFSEAGVPVSRGSVLKGEY